MLDSLILVVAVIGILGIGAQWLAWRFQLPAIVLMSLAGLIVGPMAAAVFGQPIISPEASFGTLLKPMIGLAVAIILFEGGLVLKFSDLRDSGAAVRRLVFVGGPIAWALGTVVCYYVAGLGIGTSALFAGVLVVTGPTVIMPLLRQSKLGGRVGKSLKWEGIINDPIGALFAVIAFEVIRVVLSGESAFFVLSWIAFAVVLGTVLGIGMGIGMSTSFRNGWIPEFLKAPIIFVVVLACYALSESIEHETGLVAVTAFGVALGNSKFAALQDMRRFKESIAIILISGVFVILTANLTPETIVNALDWRTLGFLFLMLFVVRPITVAIATIGELNWREMALVGWIAPRGIVAVAISGFFAERLLALQDTPTGIIEGAERVTALAFAIVFATVIAHGFTIGPLARRLGLSRTGPPGVLVVGANPWSIPFARTLKDLDVDVIIADQSLRRLRPAREAGLNTFTGEVLSEEAELRMDHARFADCLALGSNDSYNALVCRHFAPELGRSKCFQLATGDREELDERGMHHGTRGRTLIRRGRGYDGLVRDYYKGWVFAKTELTEKYPLAKFLEERPEADMLAEIRPDNSIIFLGPEQAVKGGTGTRIISFGPEVSSKNPPKPTPTSGQPPADPDLPTV